MEIDKIIYAIAPFVAKIDRRPPALWINEDIKRTITDCNNTHKALKNRRFDMMLYADYMKSQNRL